MRILDNDLTRIVGMSKADATTVIKNCSKLWKIQYVDSGTLFDTIYTDTIMLTLDGDSVIAAITSDPSQTINL